jgi:hypothetical protein
MSRDPAASFAARLDLARALIARGAAPTPVHVTDQLDAAGAEARVLHDRIGATLPLLEPDRSWFQRIDSSPSDDVRAYILAAMLDCTTVCVHIRRGGPQPAFVQLPLRRVDCSRCAGTIRRPSSDEADRCDVCTTRGVTTFVPFAMLQGPALVVGDACPECADVLGIRQGQEAAS